MSTESNRPNKSSALTWQKGLGAAAVVLGVALTHGSFHDGTPTAVFTVLLLTALGGVLAAVWLLYRHLVATGQIVVRRDSRSFWRMVVVRLIVVGIAFGGAVLYRDAQPWAFVAAGVFALIQVVSVLSDFRRIEL